MSQPRAILLVLVLIATAHCAFAVTNEPTTRRRFLLDGEPLVQVDDPAVVVTGGGFAFTRVGSDRALEIGGAESKRGSALWLPLVDEFSSHNTAWVRIRKARSSDWRSGRPEWILSAIPLVGENRFPSRESGLGLAAISTGDGAIELAVHRFEEGRLNPDYRPRNATTGLAAPDFVPLRIELDAGMRFGWGWVGIGWWRESGGTRVALHVGGETRTALVAGRFSSFRNLMVGSPPRTEFEKTDTAFRGWVDELVVETDRTVGLTRPRRGSATSATTTQAPARQAPASDVDEIDPIERVARSHFDRLVSIQRPTGWSTLVSYPGGLHFLSRSDLIPYSPRHYLGTTEASSVLVAHSLLRASETLGEPRYLEAARRIGDLLLRVQGAGGHFPALALVEDGRPVRTRNPDRVNLKDRVQTMPIVFLNALAERTGDERYRAAADRCLDLVYRAQNPSGSWPHHVRLAGFVRESIHGDANGGEINDYTTTGGMNLALMKYRKTGDLASLGRYLLGADWLAEAFVDARAKGWAKQYDGDGNPIRGRHFEPAGVALQDMDDVPRTLAEAYQLTGDPRYRHVLVEWRKWMLERRGPRGWHRFYDAATGRPIKSTNNVVVPDDPKNTRDFDMGRALAFVGAVLDGDDDPARSASGHRSRADLLHRARKNAALVDPDVGTWISDEAPQGPAIVVANGRVDAILAEVASRRLEADQGDSSSASRWVSLDDVRDPFSLVSSREERFMPIDPETCARARERARAALRAR